MSRPRGPPTDGHRACGPPERSRSARSAANGLPSPHPPRTGASSDAPPSPKGPILGEARAPRFGPDPGGLADGQVVRDQSSRGILETGRMQEPPGPGHSPDPKLSEWQAMTSGPSPRFRGRILLRRGHAPVLPDQGHHGDVRPFRLVPRVPRATSPVRRGWKRTAPLPRPCLRSLSVQMRLYRTTEVAPRRFLVVAMCRDYLALRQGTGRTGGRFFFCRGTGASGREAACGPGRKSRTPRTWWVLGAESPRGGGGGS